jgi:hypothetical protein
VVQYDANHNYPNSQTLNNVRFLFFCVWWTAPVAALHSIFLLHPVWSQYRVSSIGSHSLWIFLTWIFWVAGAAALNDALPLLFILGVCGRSVNYCTQLRALFGTRSSRLALAVKVLTESFLRSLCSDQHTNTDIWDAGCGMACMEDHTSSI